MKKLVFTFILVVTSLNIFAQKVQDIEIEHVLSLYKNQKAVKKLKISSQKTELANVFYNKDFFVVISSDKCFSPVMAYSKTNGIDDLYIEEFKQFIESIYEKQEQKLLEDPKAANKSQEEWGDLLIKNDVKEVTYGPLIQSLFGQVNCKDQNGNTINVSNIFTPQNVAAGCVAVSQATVLHYFAWPNQGMETHSYFDSYGSISGDHTINYDSSFYEMDKIKDRYHNQESTTEERKALGTLVYESAVSINMDFENDGSTSNINRIPEALASYFRFASNYNSVDITDFWQKVDTNIISGFPVILSVKSDNGWGHSVVCSGLKIFDNGNKYYHLNMGWWGSSNGWYQIHDEFNAGGYTSVTGGVFNIIPNAHLFEPEFNVENNELSLEWDYPGFPEFDNYQLQMKLGRENWTVVEDFYYDNTYTTILDGSTTYSFRVKPQSTDENILWGWSNYISFSDYISGIDDRVSQSISCYPNPTQDILYININRSVVSSCSIEIFNINGNLVKSDFKILDEEFTINVKDLQQGSYIIRLAYDNQSFTHLFFKTNR